MVNINNITNIFPSISIWPMIKCLCINLDIKQMIACFVSLIIVLWCKDWNKEMRWTLHNLINVLSLLFSFFFNLSSLSLSTITYIALSIFLLSNYHSLYISFFLPISLCSPLLPDLDVMLIGNNFKSHQLSVFTGFIPIGINNQKLRDCTIAQNKIEVSEFATSSYTKMYR